MKMLKIIAPFILVCFLISCKKEDSTNNNGNTSSKIKTYREDVIAGAEHDSATFDVGYDNSDRIIIRRIRAVTSMFITAQTSLLKIFFTTSRMA